MVTRTIERVEEQRSQIAERLRRIDKKIAVMAGKGGVGKTTIAVNVAAVLAEKKSVGLLDADIDCPNVNKFLGIEEKFRISDRVIYPVEKFGMKIASMASLQEAEDTAIIWRGPMISHAILQFVESVEWGRLDYLIIDSPPGTSDAALTIMQLMQPDGIVVVTTPHRVSVTDARKTINMAKKMNIRILGIVENMSGWASGSVKEEAERLQARFLGSIGMEKELYEFSNKGMLPVKESSRIREAFVNIVNNIGAELQ